MDTRHVWFPAMRHEDGHLSQGCTKCGVSQESPEAENICRDAPATYGDVKDLADKVTEMLVILGQRSKP